MRRSLILLLPVLALIVWLVVAQFPLWTAPQPAWFPSDTPAMCAAVRSLALYHARPVDPADQIGREAAHARAAQVIADHYETAPLALSEPLMVEAALPGGLRGVFAVVTARLTDTVPEQAAVVYLDAATGEPRALITAMVDPASDCDFDLPRALLAGLKSPPLLLLVAYVLITAVVLLVRRLARRRLP